MRPLLPTLKERKRYLVYEIRAAQPVQEPFELLGELERALGLFGSAEAGIQHVSYDPKTGRGVLRTSLKAAPKVRAALMMVTELKANKVRVRIIGSSGILNKTERFMNKVEV